MFKFLKDKLKGAIDKLTDGIDKQGKEETVETEVPEQEVPGQKVPVQKTQAKKAPEASSKKGSTEAKEESEKGEKQGFFSKIGKFFKKETTEEEPLVKEETKQQKPEQPATVAKKEEIKLPPQKKQPPQRKEEYQEEEKQEKKTQEEKEPEEKKPEKKISPDEKILPEKKAIPPKSATVIETSVPQRKETSLKKITPIPPSKPEKILEEEKKLVEDAEKIIEEEKEILQQEQELLKLTEPVQEELQEEIREELQEDHQELPKDLDKTQEKKDKKVFPSILAREQPTQEKESEATREEAPKEQPVEKPEIKQGFFSRLKQTFTTKKISQQQFDELFWEIELALLENNVAVEVLEQIKKDLSDAIVEQPIQRNKIKDTIIISLKDSIKNLFDVPKIDVLANADKKKPYIICMVGVNGSGKTTTIAKLAQYFLDHKKTVVLAAADTFRAAAIDQLDHHAQKLGVKCIKHDYGSDAAAVAFEAIKHAEQKGKDIVLIDTAGRLHSNKNLMEELKKVVRVAKPDLTLFIGESITGNDCVEQAKQFSEAVQIDGIVLSKADIDEKGGAAISVSYVTKKPILYLGIGQEYKDLKEFDADLMMENLGLA